MRNDIKELTDKLTKFFNGTEPQTLIQVRGVRELSEKSERALNSYKFPGDMVEYLKKRGEKEEIYWEKRMELKDDLLPSIAPWYGIAEHTAFLGGEVEFSESTSYNHIIMPDWKDFDKLKLDESHPWLRMVIDGIAYYRENWGKTLLPKLRGADGPSDIANIVRGNELFYDVYDEPELVEKLIDFCAGAVRFTLELQKKAAGMVYGGYVTGFDIWMPGDCIGQISEDASCMMSPEIYRELFLNGLKKTVKGYEHTMMHVHTLGKVMLPIFAQLPEIDVMEISSDPNCDRAIDVWRQYKDILENKVVITAPTFDELKANKDLFEGRRSVIWYYAKTLEEAKEVVEWTRNLKV